MRRISTWVVLLGVLLVCSGLLLASRRTLSELSIRTPIAVPTQISQLAPVLSSTPLLLRATPSPVPKVLHATPPPSPSAILIPSPAALHLREFDGQRAYAHVLAQEALGPRPTGSQAGWATGDYIIQQLKDLDWTVETQEFVHRGVRGRNVVGKAGKGPVVLIGAHYDTRPVADRDPNPENQGQPILGANDGGSGVAVLLELARVLDRDSLDRQVWLAFFDAEDRGRLDGWPYSVGAREMAKNLVVRPQAVVVVDMVGDVDQKIPYEGYSDPDLAAEIWAVAAELGYDENIISEPGRKIIDDHLPFVELGIPAVDIIDFDYPFWHTLQDTADKVSPTSLERVGRTLEAWLEAE